MRRLVIRSAIFVAALVTASAIPVSINWSPQGRPKLSTDHALDVVSGHRCAAELRLMNGVCVR